MELEQSNEVDKLFTAVSKMQAELKGSITGAENPFFHSKYSTLQDVWNAIREPLTKNGLCIIQTNSPDQDGVIIVTTLGHTSGQFIRGRLLIRPTKNDPQGVGSAITYGRRYALASISGIYQDDDDGNEASKPHLSNATPDVRSAPRYAPYPPSADDGKHGQCEVCGSNLRVSKAGTSVFCPNFKDTSKGEHTRRPLNQPNPQKSLLVDDNENPPPWIRDDVP